MLMFFPVLSNLLVWYLTDFSFKFDRLLYKQISGAAIGTVMAVYYSVIYMHVFEGQAISAHDLKPYLWLHFIDDILLSGRTVNKNYSILFHT